MRHKYFAKRELERRAEEVLRLALAEDRHDEDITSKALIRADEVGTLQVVAKQKLLCVGIDFVRIGFRLADKTCGFRPKVRDGERIANRGVIAEIKGRIGKLLAAERSVLNLLQLLCGIATQTDLWRRKMPPKVQLLDTRKTIPGLRLLSKYAVFVGGGTPHRLNLAETAMIKDNHLRASGGINEAVEKITERGYKSIILECDTLRQLQTALKTDKVKRILLDNMSVKQLKQAVQYADGRAFLEASGGITLDNIARVARSGVDAVSVGALTQNPPRADISCRLLPQ